MKKILAILLTGVIIAGIGFAVGIGINYILSKNKDFRKLRKPLI